MVKIRISIPVAVSYTHLDVYKRQTPTSDLRLGQEVYLIHVGYQHLKLAAPMFDKDLLAGVENIIHRPMVEHVPF